MKFKPEIIVAIVIAVLLIGGGTFLFASSKNKIPQNKVVSGENNSVAGEIEKTTDAQNKKPAVPVKPSSSGPVVSAHPTYTEIVKPSGFVNSEPFMLKDIVGKKVILVDILTYSCINCQRTFPYLNAWYDKYKDKGLEIVGIHTPEFAFEKNIDNVRTAMTGFGIKFPIVLDNDYATWTAYKNIYWPHKYLIDIHGNVVYDHVGEGNYDETEKEIQKLLDERAIALNTNDTVGKDLAKPKDTAGSIESRSPETYFGALRNTLLGNGNSHSTGLKTFSAPTTILPNTLYLVGDWDIDQEFAQSKSVNAKIIYKYNAKNIFFVAGADTEIPITVMQDGKVVGAPIKVKNSTLYTLVKNPEAGEHTIEIVIPTAGLNAFTFTFG
jgi:thiol-disulfide isomerase/thioredoxin